VPENQQTLQSAQRLLERTRYYDVARELGVIVGRRNAMERSHHSRS